MEPQLTKAEKRRAWLQTPRGRELHNGRMMRYYHLHKEERREKLRASWRRAYQKKREKKRLQRISDGYNSRGKTNSHASNDQE